MGPAQLQFAVEGQLTRLEPTLATHYVRGCAGFTGLPAARRRPVIEGLSRTLRDALGERWSEWGTEQVTVNLLTANSPGVVLLAPPEYSTYEARLLSTRARFVHFMGSHRFQGTAYRRLATEVIAALRAETRSRCSATGRRRFPGWTRPGR
jgi:hypothetical protein